MILIADSGSTKAEWVAVQEGTASESIISRGINPYHLSPEQIKAVLSEDLAVLAGRSFEKIFFYGTGCNTTMKEEIIAGELGRFVNSTSLFVGSDLLGAARALCKDKPGIACILGTGSNSCYYDGRDIKSNIPPLGYILGDEGSAAAMGKKLIAGYLKGLLPPEVAGLFRDRYETSQAAILDSVYRQPFPSRYLGQFAQFLSSNMEIPEIREIVTSSIDEFIVRNILRYPEALKSEVHLTGGIAFHFRDTVIERLGQHNLNAGIITRSPMSELIRYHNNNY